MNRINLGTLDLSALTPQQQSILLKALNSSPDNFFPKEKYQYIEEGVIYEFNLPDHLIKAESISHPGELRYWVIDGNAKPIAAGGFGAILPIKAKINPLENDTLLYKPFVELTKVAKIQYDVKDVKKVITEREDTLTQEFPEINSKPTVYQDTTSFTVMNYLPGKQVFDIVEKPGVSMTDWLSMFVKMAYGLQRIHDKNIIHRDIKTENMIIDSVAQQLTIFDFGLSKRKDEIILENAGSLGYAAPDPIKDEAADVYSLGKTLQLIATYAPVFKKNGIPVELHLLMRQMTQDIQAKRISLPDAIKALEKLHFSIKYLALTDQRKKDELLLANQMGYLARKNIRDYLGSDNRGNKSFADEMLNAITRNFDKVKDNADCMTEFFDRLNIKIFFPFKNMSKTDAKQAIKNKVNTLLDEFDKNAELLLNVQSRLEGLANKVDDNYIKNLLLKRLNEVGAIFDKHKKYGSSLDEISTLNEIFKKAITKYNLIADRFNVTPEQLELMKLKINLKYAVKAYFLRHEMDGLVKTHGSVINAIDAFELNHDVLGGFQKDNRFSDRRKKDAGDLLDIINNAKNADELVKNVEERLKSVKRGVFNTRFAKSELVDNVNDVLEGYKDFKRRKEEPEERM